MLRATHSKYRRDYSVHVLLLTASPWYFSASFVVKNPGTSSGLETAAKHNNNQTFTRCVDFSQAHKMLSSMKITTGSCQQKHLETPKKAKLNSKASDSMTPTLHMSRQVSSPSYDRLLNLRKLMCFRLPLSSCYYQLKVRMSHDGPIIGCELQCKL